MKKFTKLLVLGFSLTLIACGTPADDETEGISKDEASQLGKGDWSQDWCEVFDWYGDGICDDFCPNPDPDCDEEVNCLIEDVAPSCDAGFVLVDEFACGAAGDECQTTELCEIESHCLFVGEACPQVVGTEASCPADTFPVDECREGQGCLVTRGSGDKCSEFQLCEPIRFNCFAEPTCLGNDMAVNEATCDVAGDRCETQEICGETLHCLEVADVCAQVVGTSPVCPADARKVEQCNEGSDCLIFNGTGDKCDITIFCQPEIEICEAFPVCQSNELEVSDDACDAAGNSCRTAAICGEEINCWDFPKFCAQVVGTPASCDVDQTEVSGCSKTDLNSGACELRNGSGDKCADYIYCLDN